MSTARRKASDKNISIGNAKYESISLLTTQQGVQIPENHNSLKAGPRGPTLMEDFILREKLSHFDHERIPERVVHARGASAHGFFKLYKPLSLYTSADFLQDPAIETPVFVRFSTAIGSRGSADTVRDVRGFAVKFYTAQGNYDLVGNNMPVYFIQDAIKFPDLVHALKPEPHQELPQASSAHDTFWDFVSLMPESTHMLMWLMSDRAIPRSYRMMEGFGVHTFRLVNSHGQSCCVKFHWKPRLGLHSMAWDEAQKIAGQDPDFHRRDLWDAIEKGHFPEWELGVQLIEESKEAELGIDLLDATKLIPEEMVPILPIGRMVLNRNPANFFAESEQVAFNPGNLVPGIDFSNDPLLQGRLFSYTDSQLSRLGGPNAQGLPINRPICPVHHFQRGGSHQYTSHKGRVSYEPNTLSAGTEFRVDGSAQGFQSSPDAVAPIKKRHQSPSFDDHFSQATLFWNSQSQVEKDHIVAAFRFDLSNVETTEIRQRMVDNLAHVDMKLATRVGAQLGIHIPDPSAAAGRLGFRDYKKKSLLDEAPSLSMVGRYKPDIRTRKVAVLAADGVDLTSVKRVILELTAVGLTCQVIGPHLGHIRTASGRTLAVDLTFSNTSSVMFDAVLLPGGLGSAEQLCGLGKAVHFALEAYKHGKPICAINEGAHLLSTLGFSMCPQKDSALTVPTPGVVIVDSLKAIDGQISQAFIAAMLPYRHWDRVNLDSVAV